MFKKLAISSIAVLGSILMFVGATTAADSVPQWNGSTDSPYNNGNEADFVMVGPANGASSTFSNNYELCNGGVSDVRIYIHNNASTNFNGPNNDGPSVIQGATLNVGVPTVASDSHTISATLNGSNAEAVFDTATLNCPNPVELSYVPGTAKIYTAAQSGGTVNDSVVNGFAPIGHFAQDGVWPGCYEFQGFVYLQVQATAVEQPDPEVNLNLKKYVNGEDAQDVNSAVVLETGETASWKIDVANTGPDTATNVVVEDPVVNGIGNETNVSTTAGTYNAVSNVWTIPSLAAGTTASLSFDTEVTAESGVVTNVATITGADQEDKDGTANNTDPAVIAIDNPEVPVNTCSSMIMVSTEKVGDKVNATLKVETNHDGNITKVVYTITDEDGNSRDVTVDGSTNVTTMFDTAGTYTITAVVSFDNEGNEATCSTTLTVEEDTVTIVKSETVVKEVLGTNTVKELPKTGAGSLAGLFGLSALGASVKGYFTSRKNLKDTLLNR